MKTAKIKSWLRRLGKISKEFEGYYATLRAEDPTHYPEEPLPLRVFEDAFNKLWKMRR